MVVVWTRANAEEGFMLEGRMCVEAPAACFTAFHFTAILSGFFGILSLASNLEHQSVKGQGVNDDVGSCVSRNNVWTETSRFVMEDLEATMTTVHTESLQS